MHQFTAQHLLNLQKEGKTQPTSDFFEDPLKASDKDESSAKGDQKPEAKAKWENETNEEKAQLTLDQVGSFHVPEFSEGKMLGEIFDQFPS